MGYFAGEIQAEKNSFTQHSSSSIRSLARKSMLLITCVFCSVSIAYSQVSVTTYHNDIGRTGQNLSETALNTSNVNSTLFGKLFSQPVDGLMFAQPLYLSGVTIAGVSHNVVFAATEHDSVYAFDADSNGGTNATPLWQASMLSAAHGAAAGATTVSSNLVGSDISPEIGITGTPVIDPTTGTLYVVSKTYENGAAVQRLHALDVTSGAEKFGGPAVITATVPGTGNGSVNGSLTFDPLWESNRPGLLLLNGIVYIGFGSHGDNGPWHGWILGYNAATLQQTGVFCASPNGTGAGFWMAGEGLAADQLDPVNHPFGRMFVPTGNGDYNATTPYTNNMDYGDTHLALDLTNGVPTVEDEFTTNLQAQLNSMDGDVASGGMIVLPTQTTGPTPHLAVQAGKQGTLYLLNRDNMGGYNLTTDQAVQEQAYSVGDVGVWSTAAYWNGNVYIWGRFDNLKSFALANGLLSTTPTKSSEEYGYPGSTPSISANGNSQGIVWTIDSEYYPTSGAAVLQAHDASNVATTLYSSATNPTRDAAGPAVKFTVPTVVNGKVYVGTTNQVDIYGLLNGATQTSAPILTPGTESYSGSISVAITDSTPNATIYYTTDGSIPTSTSTIYTAPIAVSSTETITAIASATGLLVSAPTTSTYTNTSQATAVTFSLPTGTYSAAQSISLSDSTAGATIYYTTDGSTPTTASAVYTAPLAVSSTETITALATAPGVSNSPILAQTYTIQSGQSEIDFTQGFAASSGLMILNAYATLNDSRLQITTGLNIEESSAWFHTPVNIQTFTTDFTIQLSNPGANGMTFAIQNAGANVNALGGNGSGLGYSGIGNSLAIKFDFFTPVGTGTDSTGLYTNGVSPTTPAIDLSSTGINLLSDDTMAVHLVYDGTTLTMTITDMVTAATWSTSWTINIPSIVGSNTAYVGFTGSTGAETASQKVLTWSFFPGAGSTTTAAPTFSPAAGTYTGAQTVAISDSTSGATIYYTTNGATPTTSSTVYTAPITVSATETLQTFAVASGLTNSPVTSAAYTINAGAVATPAFVPVGGAYTSAQSVTMSDSTTGATIYYTTNGTTPTTASSVYSGPVQVASTETLKAIAISSGLSNSSVASSVYTISTPSAATPVFSPVAGTYTSAQAVTITDSTVGATIYYTTNGTTPTSASTLYSGAIKVSSTETLQAIAIASGYSNSAVASAAYTITALITATPAFSLPAGTYTATQTVTLSDTTTGAVIYYTTDGSTPTTASNVYTSPITVSSTETLTAIAVAPGYTQSSALANTYTVQSGGTTVSFAQGFASAGNTVVLNGYAAVVGSRLRLTNGGSGQYASAWYSKKLSVLSFTTNFTFQDTSASADGMTFAIQNAPANVNALGGNSGSLGYGGITNSIAVKFDLFNNSGEGSDSTGLYTNGAAPTVPAVDMSASPINLHSGDTMAAQITYDGTTLSLSITDTVTGGVFSTSWLINIASTIGSNTAYFGFTGGTGGSSATQDIVTWTYTSGASSLAATPTFSPVAGTYTSAQSVAISDSTIGATIYYTTNGTTPTTASTQYSAPVSVAASETLQAIAVATGYTNSAVGSAAYTVNLPVAATPAFSPAGGTYTSAQTVGITDSTAGAIIYYTTNGSVPTTSSAVYSTPLTVGATETLQAIAVAAGYSNSAVGTAAYTINLPVVATPSFLPVGGTYTSAQTVTISDATAGATVYYTTNGATPTTASTVYSGPISISSSETLKAIAVASGSTNSAVSSASYTISLTAATPTFSPIAGTYTSAQSVAISDATPAAIIYYTTNGTVPTTASAVYSAPVNVAASETLQAIAVATGFTNSAVGSAAYTINLPAAATPTFLPVAGTYTGTQSVTISDATANSTIYYTTNGITPTTASTQYSGAISVTSTETLQAIAVASGYGNSASGSAAYTINQPAAAAPVLSLPAGAYTSAQTVSISDATAGAAIYYTTNGSTPTTSSAVYSGPIAVSASETLQAIATATGYANSPVASAAYTINLPVAAAPTFSPVAGTYTGAQTVTIADATSGATIHYTTNGNTPTTSSAIYTSSITVGSTETLQALAVETGYTNSTVASAAYTINLPVAATPTFSPAAGTYTSAQSVTISDTAAGAIIYYTTNGTAPTTSSPVYSAPLSVSTSETLQAIAVAPGFATSAVGSSAYVIQTAATTISLGSGFSSSSKVVYNGYAKLNGTSAELTNGGSGEAGSFWYKTPMNVGAFTTNFTFQQTSAAADGMTFAIENSPSNVNALGGNGAGLGYSSLTKSVAIKFDLYSNAGEGPDSTGLYQNGATPTTPFVDLSSTGINLHSGDVMAVQITYDGTTLTMTITDQVTAATYTTSWAVNIPSIVGGSTAYVGFTGGTGGLVATQNVLTWTYTSD